MYKGPKLIRVKWYNIISYYIRTGDWLLANLIWVVINTSRSVQDKPEARSDKRVKRTDVPCNYVN